MIRTRLSIYYNTRKVWLYVLGSTLIHFSSQWESSRLFNQTRENSAVIYSYYDSSSLHFPLRQRHFYSIGCARVMVWSYSSVWTLAHKHIKSLRVRQLPSRDWNTTTPQWKNVTKLQRPKYRERYYDSYNFPWSLFFLTSPMPSFRHSQWVKLVFYRNSTHHMCVYIHRCGSFSIPLYSRI